MGVATFWLTSLVPRPRPKKKGKGSGDWRAFAGFGRLWVRADTASAQTNLESDWLVARLYCYIPADSESYDRAKAVI